MPAPMVPAPTTPTGIARSSGATPATLPRSRPDPTPVVKIVVQPLGRPRAPPAAQRSSRPWWLLVPGPLVRHPLPERGAVMTRLAQNCDHASYPFVAEPEVVPMPVTLD